MDPLQEISAKSNLYLHSVFTECRVHIQQPSELYEHASAYAHGAAFGRLEDLSLRQSSKVQYP